MNSKIQLSIVVPCFNEAMNIPLLLEKFKDVIHTNHIQVVLVNNGSHDDSYEVLKKLSSKFDFLKVVNIRKNIGYGHGIKTGLEQADGEYIGYTHADMQTDPGDTIRAFEIINNDKNPKLLFIKGSRKKRPLVDNFFTIGMSIFESLYLRTRLWDINAQPNVFHKSFYHKVGNECPNDFSLDLYFLYRAKKLNFNVKRFSVFFPARIHGNSSWNTGFSARWKFIKRTFSFSVTLKKEL